MKKIMVAEDDSEIFEVMKSILQMDNYEVVGIEKNKEIIDLVKQENPQLLLMDIWIWDQDGREICKEVKKLMPNLSVVMISASQDLEENSITCNADGFLKKPFEIDDLLALAKKYLN